MPTGININAITPYSTGIINVINNLLVPVLMAIALIVFFWGVYKYFIYGADNETERETGRQFVLWGVIGFVIILSLWGLVNLVMGTFGLSAGTAPRFPTIGNATGVNTSGNQTYTGVNTGGTNTGAGSNVYRSNGSILGHVNSSGQIVNNGTVIGRIQNGQPYTLSGTAITGATADNGACPSGTVRDYYDGGCVSGTADTTGATADNGACPSGTVRDYYDGGCVSDTAQTTGQTTDTNYCTDPDTE